MPSELVGLIEGLALHKPKLSAAAIHQRVKTIAEARNWPIPSNATVHAVVEALDPALVTLAHHGAAAYRDRFKTIHRHRADKPNVVWQADHTLLDLLILDANGDPVRPWLTIVLDDHSCAVARDAVFYWSPVCHPDSPCAATGVLAQRHAVWAICGLPDVLYTDHGGDLLVSTLSRSRLICASSLFSRW